jgi:hypothetical protein
MSSRSAIASVAAVSVGLHRQNFPTAASPIRTFSSCLYPRSSGADSAVVFRALKNSSLWALSRYNCLSIVSVGTFCLIHSMHDKMAFVCFPALLQTLYLLSSVVVSTVLRAEFSFSVTVLTPSFLQAAKTVDFAASKVDCVRAPAARLESPILHGSKLGSEFLKFQ